ncbi:MAG: DUF4838 domain-containing protein [Phycisphaeraceae bacterium]
MHRGSVICRALVTTGAGRFRAAAASALMVMVTMALSGEAAALTLIDEGQSRAAIVLADKPTRSARLAAHELQAHLRLVSGAEVPIVHETDAPGDDVVPIYVGESRATRAMGLMSYQFPPHHWLVRATSEHVVLIGRDDADYGEVRYDSLGTWRGFKASEPFYRVGTLYAVYDFLERFCDVRWYMITDVGRVAPQRQTVALDPTEQRGRTWTTYRRLGNPAWGKPGDQGEVDLRGIRRYRERPSRRDMNLHVLRSRMACEPFGVNHSVHDYHERFGERHPEWFVDDNPAPMTQLRFHRSDVVEQVAEDAKAFFALPFARRRHGAELSHAAERGAGDFFPVVPLDNRNFSNAADPPPQPDRQGRGFGGGVYSNYVFTWVNRVAERVAEVYPEGWISTIAYAGMFEPPQFDMAGNVAVMVCMVDDWEESSYGMEVLRDWRRRVSRLYTWEYHYAAHRFPAVRPRRVADYIERLRAMGVDGMFMEKGDLNPAIAHLDYYIESRMLTDAEADVETLLSEYFERFYGPAAEPMATFWNTVEQMHEVSRETERVQSWAVAAANDRLETLRQCMDEAEELAAGREPYAERLAVIRKGMLEVIETETAAARQKLAHDIPHLPVPRLSTAPQLDGRLDDDAWTEAAETPRFVTMMNNETDVQTRARLGYDDEHLYIAVRCEEPRIEHMRLDQESNNSAICTDDSVEINLNMDPDTDDYVQIMVSAEGLTWSWWRGKHTPQNSPDLELRAATHIGDGQWAVELAVPWRHIVDQPPGAGDQWRLNVMRNRFAMEGRQRFDERIWSAWSPPFAWSWHIKERFGRVTFE